MKRGMATWYMVNGRNELAVFIGTDMDGQPVIQLDSAEPKRVSWANLSQVLKEDTENK